ncbi:hypothetical protein DSL72_000096 [Monilinia vaccinii-corymbosi]|uniref:Uncharacterized protein n=1 Tax=Monilinia vaccinii-corymbosi TaxID=61207 RepID=A0A8A3P0S5_9HELO|nr:hypothetical protein DSL72_000096 [Monilinia vaccinii-corymbosi]
MSRRFFSMSGNFDDPTSHSTSQSPFQTAEQLVQDILQNGPESNAQISPSGELYRAIERYTQERRAEGPIPSYYSPETIRSMSSSERRVDRNRAVERHRSVRRRARRASIHPMILPPFQTLTEEIARSRRRITLARQQNEAAPTEQQDTARPAQAPPGRRRPRLFQSDRYMEPQRALHDGNSLTSGLAGDLIHLENFQALAESYGNSTSGSSPEYVAEGEHNRRVKRRKLDPDNKKESWEGFKYGRYGQVEPGTLQMEIVSCDGGLFQNGVEGEYGLENVLKDDDTVYCTKSNRCNMILKHRGETTFSLTEIAIRAPHKGYTAPVQEGMVFVSGTSNDLLTRTAQYQIQYSSPPRNSERPSIMSINHNIDGTSSITTAQARAGRLVALGAQDPECDLNPPYVPPTAQIPSYFTNIASPYQVTIECSSDFSDNDDPPPRRRRDYRIRVRDISDDENLRLVDGESSNEEDLSAPYRPTISNYRYDPTITLQSSRRRETASNITLAEAAEASQIATQEAVRAVGGELMVPHAKFFIERDKSKCTIKFSTPISGKYILLKLWSPDGSVDGNIDIQSVVAKGFAGPRLFPKVTTI